MGNQGEQQPKLLSLPRLLWERKPNNDEPCAAEFFLKILRLFCAYFSQTGLAYRSSDEKRKRCLAKPPPCPWRVAKKKTKFFQKMPRRVGKNAFPCGVGSERENGRSNDRGKREFLRARFYRGAIIRCPLILSHRNLVGDCIPQTLLLRLTPERAPKIKPLRICEH